MQCSSQNFIVEWWWVCIREVCLNCVTYVIHIQKANKSLRSAFVKRSFDRTGVTFHFNYNGVRTEMKWE